MHFKMLSAICCNLVQSKILLSGNGLIFYKKFAEWGSEPVIPLFLYGSDWATGALQTKKRCRFTPIYGKNYYELGFDLFFGYFF